MIDINKNKLVLVNIACGNSYIDGWVNFDYSPVSAAVIKANLLEPLPLNDMSVDVVYSSHFFEHIPQKSINPFLTECFRVLKPNGKIRLVLPDLEEMCRTYLKMRDEQEHQKADFLVLEMLDQMVRQKPGGELGSYYFNILESNKSEMKDYIAERTGMFLTSPTIKCAKIHSQSIFSKVFKFISKPSSLWSKIEPIYCRAVTSLLPAAFLEQNVSFALVGERHAWIYDFYTLSKLLSQAGFSEVKKLNFNQSEILNFPLYPLDMTKNGFSRKGLESMYIEATKY